MRAIRGTKGPQAVIQTTLVHSTRGGLTLGGLFQRTFDQRQAAVGLFAQ